jgi:two-component system cell cycle sensor histidine kinase/response regulator CckA
MAVRKRRGPRPAAGTRANHAIAFGDRGQSAYTSPDVEVLADSIPQLVWIAHPDGWIYWYNRRWYEYTGTTPEEMTGWGWRSVHDPDILPRVMDRWQQSIRTGEPFEMEFPLRRADGIFHWFLTRVAPLRNGAGEITRWYGTNTDISELKQAEHRIRASEEKLRESENRLLIAVHAAKMGIWEWNLESGEITCSDRCRDLFGLGRDDKAEYQEFTNALHPDDRVPTEFAIRNAIDQKKDYTGVMRVAIPGSPIRWILSNGRAMYDERGVAVRMTGVAQDITEHRLIEDRVRQTQKLESLGILAGGVAHDFNNLLTGIMGGTSLALDELGEESPVSSLLRTVLLSSDRAAALTRHMLAYSGMGQFLLQQVDLSTTVRKTVPLVEHFVSKKIKLALNLVDDLPPIVADQSQIEQVIMNLLTNAGEAIGDCHGTIEIRTAVRLVDPCCSPSTAELKPGAYATLTVRDTGCGMTLDQQSKIFDPFFTTKATGRGLGLAAIHGIVRGHNGVIDVASKPGEGTQFQIFFPAGASSRCPSESGQAARDFTHRDSLRGTTVLVVDDEEAVRHIAQTALLAQGCKVLLARGGGEAIDLLTVHSDQVSVVLLDLNMPGLSGRESLSFLRSVQPKLKVIISTGFVETNVIKQFEHENISGVLNKPYGASALVNAVAGAIRQSKM